MWPLYVKNMTKQKSVFHWEIAFKYQILPVKRRNLIRENPRKLLISYPWKKNPSVKNSFKVSVKILDCPWKVGKKCAWKPVLYPWKNSKKGPKMAFTGTFNFHGKKKRWVILHPILTISCAVSPKHLRSSRTCWCWYHDTEHQASNA